MSKLLTTSRLFMSAAVVFGLNACGGSVDSSSSSSGVSSSVAPTSSSSTPVVSSSSSVVSSSSSSSLDDYSYVVPQPLPRAVNQSVVRYVYFIEKGEEFDQARYDAIKEHAFTMQQYWYEQFGGTFYLYDQIVDVIYADNDADWYVNQPDGFQNDPRWYRLGNVYQEVYRKLDVNDFDDQVRTITYPTTRSDGHVGANFGGAWMDGDDLDCLVGSNNGYNYPYPDGNAAHCTGHVSHEFGHVFGLGHTGPDNDCMKWGFYITGNGGAMCDFSQSNRDIVKSTTSNQPFLSASPGQVVTPQGNVEAR